jgi:two-component system response regulator NreC
MTTESLTPREQQVSEYLCLGWHNKEIAQVLHISLCTVESYRANIYKKLKVGNAVELVRKVYRIEEMAG